MILSRIASAIRFHMCINIIGFTWRHKVDDTISLLKHAYSCILKTSPKKTEYFQIKRLIFFRISSQNIDCGYSLEPPRWGGSNEYPQSMFLSRNKKNNVYPLKRQFYYIKVGFKGGQNYIGVFSWWLFESLVSSDYNEYQQHIYALRDSLIRQLY